MSSPRMREPRIAVFFNHMSLSGMLAPLVPKRLCHSAHNMKQGTPKRCGRTKLRANPEV